MMQESTWSHIPGQEEALEAQFRHQQNLYSQPRSRSHENAMMLVQYITPSVQYHSHAYQQRTPPPSSPPSPGIDESNMQSLPSISSLLGLSDDRRGQAQQSTPESQQAAAMTPSPQFQHETLPQGSNIMVSSQLKVILPPTPPLDPVPLIDGNNSPTALSAHSTVSPSVSPSAYYMHGHRDTMQQRHGYDGGVVSRSGAMTPHPLDIFSFSAGGYPLSPDHTSSTATLASSSPYCPSNTPILPSSGMCIQRPLPSNCSPTAYIPLASSLMGVTPTPFQHHHYINQDCQSTFPQAQDRFICPVCNKAFSRPSSLRIHSHSHTGEKPFKCRHPSCGKAFSVRSNMKRHERGCLGDNGMIHSI